MNEQNTLRSNLFRTTFFLLLAVFSISTFISCEKDPVTPAPMTGDPDPTVDSIPDIVITHPADLYVGDISGKVLDENSEALADVKIEVRGKEVRTDENGFFNLQNIQLDAQGTLVTASRENYWSITKLVALSKDQVSQTRIVLPAKAEIRNVEASIGGMVNFGEAVKINFPSDAFVTADGTVYTGEVEVSAVHLDPADENFEMMSPGDFRAFNADSELQTLMSLGMAGVELRGANDEILELKTDRSTTLYIKVPAGSNVTEIPLWHFDEASGYWLEEGMAKREGDFFVGEVSHFSWWNCDLPFTAVKLSGTVVNDAGMGIAGLPVSIILANQGRNLGREYTGGEGIFCGWIPQGQNLIIQIRNECGAVFYEEDIGPFSGDTDLGIITISSEQIIVEVCGNLVDCNSDAVSHGYVVVYHDGTKSFIPVDATGYFCSAVNICESSDFELYGIDLDSNLKGESSMFNSMDSPIRDLNLAACDQVATFFTYQIDNEPEVLITDFVINMNVAGNIIFGANSEVNGVYPGAILDASNWGTSNFVLHFFTMRLATPNTTIECDIFECDKPTIEVEEYGGIGNPIIFKMTGTFYNGEEYLINISGTLEEI